MILDIVMSDSERLIMIKPIFMMSIAIVTYHILGAEEKFRESPPFA